MFTFIRTITAATSKQTNSESLVMIAVMPYLITDLLEMKRLAVHQPLTSFPSSLNQNHTKAQTD